MDLAMNVCIYFWCYCHKNKMYLVIFTDKDIWSITKWENGVFLILSIEVGLKFACRKHACEFDIKVLIQVSLSVTTRTNPYQMNGT